MDSQQKIQLLKRRQLGAVLSDALKFIKINFKALFISFLVLVVPIYLIGIILGNSFGGLNQVFDPLVIQESPLLFVGLFIFYCTLLISTVSVSAIVISSIVASEKKNFEPLTFNDISPLFLKSLGLVFTIYFIYLLLFIAIFGFIMYLAISFELYPIMILFLPLMIVWIYYSLYFLMMPIISLRENIGVSTAFQRSKILLSGKWWETFGVSFCAQLLSSLLTYVIIIPASIVMGIMFLSDIDSTEIDRTFGIGSTYMNTISIVSLFASIYALVALAIKYYDLVEQHENPTLKKKIFSIGADKRSKFFENDGEY